jgi:hypothetical protein
VIPEEDESVKKSVKKFLKNTRNNIGLENFASSSWTFYFLMFLIGTLEMVYSISLYFGV